VRRPTAANALCASLTAINSQHRARQSASKACVVVASVQSEGQQWVEGVRKRSRANKGENCFLYCLFSDRIISSLEAKSRRTFCPQIECLCFHTASVVSRHRQCAAQAVRDGLGAQLRDPRLRASSSGDIISERRLIRRTDVVWTNKRDNGALNRLTASRKVSKWSDRR
jgi:hypothetical protein